MPKSLALSTHLDAGPAALPEAIERPPVRPRRRFDPSFPVFLAVAAVLCVLVLLPLAWLGWYALTDANGTPTLANLTRLATDPQMRDPLLTTFGIAACSALAACGVAAPVAWLVGRTDLPCRGLIRALVTASFVTPPFLGAIAWELLAAPNSGLLNQLARGLLGLDEYDYVFDIYSQTGVVFAISCYAFPLVFTLLANALERVPADLEDASAILGGRTWDTMLRVTLPLVLPAMLAGGLVAFMQALTMFGTPAILAMPAGFHTLTTRIWSLFQYPPQTNLAAAAAVPLLLITLGVLQLQRWLLGRRSFVVVGGKNGMARRIPLGRWRLPALGFCLLVLMNPVFLPYFALLRAAMVKNLTDPLTWATLSFDHVRFALWEFSDTRRAMVNTLLLGVGSATVVTAMALVIAYLSSRRLGARAPGLGRLCHGAAGHPRHRDGRRLVPGLRPSAFRALWHALDPAGGVRDHGAAGRLPAGAGGSDRPARGIGGGRADLWRFPPSGALGRDGTVAADHHRCNVVHRVRRRHPRAVSDRAADHLQNQGHLRRNL